jgi:hypothetical protein
LLIKHGVDADKSDAPARAAAKAARIALKVRCVDLQYTHAKLSAADLKDLQTCKVLVDEDWEQALKELPGDRARAAKEDAEESARTAQRLHDVCGQLRHTKIADLTLSDLAILKSCGF